MFCVFYHKFKNGIKKGSFAFWGPQKPPKRGKGTGILEVTVEDSYSEQEVA